MDIAMLTTTDNPYNPFTQFKEWNLYDIQQGYNTNSYLGRIVKSSDDLSEPQQIEDINNAIDEIVSMNILGIYRKVVATG